MRHRSGHQNLNDIRQGGRKACEAVVCQHYQSIYSFIAYLSADAHLAEDLTQETFATAWAKLDNYQGRASIETWLHKIAYHKFIDSKRCLVRRANLMARLQQDGRNIPEGSNPLQQLTADEHLRLLGQALQRLQLHEYVVVVLHYIQGLSFREMAKVLDEPTGTVKWRTSQALKRLKTFLTDKV